MHRFQRILAATDLSAPARHAVERAALVSKDTGASLDLLHVARLAPLERLRQLIDAAPAGVVQAPSPSPVRPSTGAAPAPPAAELATGPGADIGQRVLQVARDRLHELAATLEQRFGVVATSRVLEGSLLAELARQAEGSSCDLLVCGAKGESLVRHFLLGTTAQRLLRTARCPVLVVKQSPRASYRRLLVPVDFSPSSLRSLRQARAIAPDAVIDLLHVFDVPFEGQLRFASVDTATIHRYRNAAREEATHRLHALREDAGLDPGRSRVLVMHGHPTLRIIEQEQESDCDLIVIGKHGESLLESLLIGSVTEQVLADSQGDVLVSV